MERERSTAHGRTVNSLIRDFTVPVPHLGQFFDTCSIVWQFCHSQAVPTDTNNSRTHTRRIRRGWPPGEGHPVLSLRINEKT